MFGGRAPTISALRLHCSDHGSSGSSRDDRAGLVDQFPCEESDAAASTDDAPSTNQTTRTGGPQELHMEVGSRCELTRTERGDERWPERVIEDAARNPP
jgi:hypothetical protein